MFVPLCCLGLIPEQGAALATDRHLRGALLFSFNLPKRLPQSVSETRRCLYNNALCSQV